MYFVNAAWLTGCKASDDRPGDANERRSMSFSGVATLATQPGARDDDGGGGVGVGVDERDAQRPQRVNYNDEVRLFLTQFFEVLLNSGSFLLKRD